MNLGMTTPPVSAAAGPLPDLALIEVAGADAAAFLQSQLSNDIRRVSPALAQLSSWNSAKGRMLAVLHVMSDGPDRYWLELQRSVLEPVLKRLRMFVLRSKVTLREADDRSLFGLAGAGAPRLLAQLQLPDPQAPLACAWHEGTAVMQRLGPAPRYLLVAPKAAGATLERRIAELAGPPAPDFWRRAEIEAGVPAVYPATQDRFVPQMCNLDALGGVSFDKGCYPGQEIVARVHYRGAVKRHMRMLEIPGAVPDPGAAITLADGASGEVVDAVAGTDGALVLAVTAESRGA